MRFAPHICFLAGSMFLIAGTVLNIITEMGK